MYRFHANFVLIKVWTDLNFCKTGSDVGFCVWPLWRKEAGVAGSDASTWTEVLEQKFTFVKKLEEWSYPLLFVVTFYGILKEVSALREGAPRELQMYTFLTVSLVLATTVLLV